MKVYNPDREERAFLYQEAQDLEALVKDFGSLSVMVEEGKRSRFRVTFLVAPESVGMRVQAVDSNLYEATIAAKEETLRQLNAIVNSLPRPMQVDGRNVKMPAEMLH
jgi:hypothetical protein